jgi:hypothetical protein
VPLYEFALQLAGKKKALRERDPGSYARVSRGYAART